jgi:hypothetical protein
MINSALLLSEAWALALLIYASTAVRSQQPHLMAALKARPSRQRAGHPNS